MTFEIRPFPEFSWSQTRRSLFRECPRKYYWSYYGSHNGWLDDSPEQARRAWRLKKISNLHMTLGAVVHQLASTALQDVRGGGGSPDAADLIRRGRARLNRAWLESQQRTQWERRPKALTMLLEFYRGSGPSRDLVETVRDRLHTCLRNLLESVSFREAAEAPLVEVKEVDRLDFTELDGVKLYAQPDLLYRLGDAWRIVDWKTGSRNRSHAPQLRTYAVYLRSRSDLPVGPIIGRLEYLAVGEDVSVPIGEREVAEERGRILDSVSAMRSYLADPVRNEPLPRERFPLREDAQRCPECPFFELCEDELLERGDSGPF
jgi:CRISPR/Cas system-associated exonuclease Cas4 (RecB family)